MKKNRLSILEAQSYCKVGAELKFTVEFNKDDDREYLDIISEIENAVFDILDKRGHMFVSASSKGLTKRELR